MAALILTAAIVMALAVWHSIWLFRAMISKSRPGLLRTLAVIVTLAALVLLYARAGTVLCATAYVHYEHADFSGIARVMSAFASP